MTIDGSPLPGPARSLRGLGNLREVIDRGLLQAYLRWAEEAKGTFVVSCAGVPHVVVANTAEALEVLGGEGYYRNVDPTERLFGASLLRMEGEPWRERRRLFAPSFSREAMDRALEIVVDEADRLTAEWSSLRRVEHPSRRLSFAMQRVLGRMLFGFSFDRERHASRELHRSLVVLSTGSVLRHIFPRPLAALAQARATRRAREHLDALCAEMLRDGASTPFMDALRQALARGELPRATAIDELRTFLIAGHETSATALAWTVALLAEHPEHAERLAEEHARWGPPSTWSEVAERPQAQALVHEVMRLYPPVPLSVSVAAEERTLGNLRVPAGTRVDVCSYVLHRLPWIWDAPDQLRPERFAGERAPGSYMPFLVGPHACVGRRLAMAELVVFALRLCSRLRFTLPEGAPRVDLRLSLVPRGFVLGVERIAS